VLFWPLALRIAARRGRATAAAGQGKQRERLVNVGVPVSVR